MDVEFRDIEIIGKNRFLLKATMRVPHFRMLKVQSVFSLIYHISVREDNKLHLYMIKSDMDAFKNHVQNEDKIIDPKTTERIRAFYRDRFNRELVYDDSA